MTTFDFDAGASGHPYPCPHGFGHAGGSRPLTRDIRVFDMLRPILEYAMGAQRRSDVAVLLATGLPTTLLTATGLAYHRGTMLRAELLGPTLTEEDRRSNLARIDGTFFFIFTLSKTNIFHIVAFDAVALFILEFMTQNHCALREAGRQKIWTSSF